MPRNVRMPKRKSKWCAAAFDFTVPAQASLVVGDGIALCDVTTAVNDQADPVVGWCKGAISISRATSSTPSPAVAWAITMGRLNTGTGAVVQTFNPWDKGDLERQDVLGAGICEVPPLVLTSADALIDSRGSLVTPINIKVSRKFHRNTNMLFLWVVGLGAADNTTQASGFVRTLMKF